MAIGKIDGLQFQNILESELVKFIDIFITFLLQWTIPLKDVWLNFRNLYRDSLRVQRFQTLITSLFEDFWVLNTPFRK